MIDKLLALTSGLVIIGVSIPYILDAVKGRARPSRATYLMFSILMILTLVEQHQAGSRLTLAITLGEAVSSIAIFIITLKHGMGGFSWTDGMCYVMLIVSILVWRSGHGILWALHFAVLADFIAFTPTLLKTWRDPYSETPLFYIGGTIAALLSIVAGRDYSYAVILFPTYLCVANLGALALIRRREA